MRTLAALVVRFLAERGITAKGLLWALLAGLLLAVAAFVFYIEPWSW